MNQQNLLELEILTGPLDGHMVTLESETRWTRQPGELLSFPWDEELGEPQATFSPDAEGWVLIPHRSLHNTYRVSSEERLAETISLADGDVLKASRTWLRVKKYT